jgi:peptidoglycan/xylan/chitin deacetylase (PgdA/CDA1 family)
VNPWQIVAPAALTAAAAITAYGAVNPRSNLFGQIISRTNSPKKLAITFDDGPNPKLTPELLDLLGRHQARATFFVIGKFAQACPELLLETASRGHAIGNHTANHANLLWRTPAAIRRELQQCNDTSFSIIGTTPTCFRPPWGMRNPFVISGATALGLKTVLWTTLPGDWRPKPTEWLIDRLRPIAERAQKTPSTNTGDILCLHDGDHRVLNGDRRHTLTALQYWLPRWRDLGLEFVTIDEAVSDPAR